MKSNDKLYSWFKEMPEETPSSDFNRKVMTQVMAEWRMNPSKYQPIIGKRGWWSIGSAAVLLTAVLLFVYTTFAKTSEEIVQPGFFGVDFAKPISNASNLLMKLTDLSPAVAIGLLAIVALWFFDQLFIRAVRR